MNAGVYAGTYGIANNIGNPFIPFIASGPPSRRINTGATIDTSNADRHTTGYTELQKELLQQLKIKLHAIQDPPHLEMLSNKRPHQVDCHNLKRLSLYRNLYHRPPHQKLNRKQSKRLKPSTFRNNKMPFFHKLVLVR